MRVYFEKPRTTVGWKGLINDPYLNDSFKIQDGLHVGRRLLLDIAELGLPAATEALVPLLVTAIGDRAELARQPAAVSHASRSASTSVATSEKPGPSVVGYQASS